MLDIHKENTVIMYRGKNYSQPPTEIMSPRITLSRKKVLISFYYFTYENWSQVFPLLYHSVYLRGMYTAFSFTLFSDLLLYIYNFK